MATGCRASSRTSPRSSRSRRCCSTDCVVSPAPLVSAQQAALRGRGVRPQCVAAGGAIMPFRLLHTVVDDHILPVEHVTDQGTYYTVEYETPFAVDHPRRF